MDIKVQKIGNSKGIRIPKKVIHACEISDVVELYVTGKTITIQAKRKPREGWAKAAKAMHQRGDDKLFLPDELDTNVHSPWKK
ncbi:MAG: AbrB/MazE/SpoVT family DNA-binding domain-containing protein [candidate division KSB1 bacterium]|nr:AbrB/MazE/SpoVT family DNA-binding domain-containing protein [candidate division KSB1 bacterium]